MNLLPESSSNGEQKKKSIIPWDSVIASVVFHVVLILGAAFVTVLVVKARQPVMFDGKKPPGIPPRKLEHSIRVKQMQKQVRKPQILERLVSKTPSAVALPDIPSMEKPDIKTLRDQMMTRTMAGGNMGGLGGSGGGAGRGLTGGGGYSDTQFFGQNIRTRAVCILMDISPSMVTKGVTEQVREEAMAMLSKLHPGTRFNVIVFVDGATPFTEQMVFATKENRDKALEWLAQEFRPGWQGNRRGFSGSTPSQAIEVAVEMGCDTMFVLTDDPPYLKEGTAETGVELEDHKKDILDYAKDIETAQGRHVTIHTLCYKPREGERGAEAKRFLKRLASATGGRFKLIKD